MGLAYRRFSRIELQDEQDGTSDLRFSRTSLLPEYVTLETIYFLNNSAVGEYVYACMIDIEEASRYHEIVIVRNRMARYVWWVVFRIWESMILTKSYIIRLLAIWKMAHYPPPGSRSSWHQIIPVNWVGKRLRIWD